MVHSTCGVQQGDPLGPLPFSLTLQPALRAASEAASLDLCFAYLDDVVLAGSASQVTSVLRAFCQTAGEAGLVLEPSKSEAVLSGPTSSADLRGLPAGFARHTGQFELGLRWGALPSATSIR